MLENTQSTDCKIPTQPADCDTSLLTLNERIMEALKTYLPGISDKTIEIRFDMPDKDKLPNCPTLCVFLYDIQEDLELRHAQARPYHVYDQKLAPRLTHVRCCYLVTYWESPSNTQTGPKSQSMTVMNAVLNALLNADLSRPVQPSLSPMPPSFLRVIAPTEHLSSLGNFWQSLGDRPRLCLNFTVTIPVELRSDKDDKEKPVLDPQIELIEQPVAQLWEQYDKSLLFKRALVEKVLQEVKEDQMSRAHAQLARLTVTCEYEQPDLAPKVRVEGLLDTTMYSLVKQVIDEHQAEWEKIGVQVPVDDVRLTEVRIG